MFDINERLSRDPDFYYNKELIEVWNALNPNQRQQMCDFINMQEINYGNEFFTRALTEIGRSIYFNIDMPTEIYNPSHHFRDLAIHRIKRFEALNQQPQISQENQYKQKMFDIISQYGLKQDRVFFDFVDFTNGNIPRQGWKLHVAADNLKDYCELMETLVPELVANNVQFKIVNPNEFLTDFSTKNIYGKEFTIYPTDGFKLDNFSQKFINKLFSKSERMASSDKRFGNSRVSGRYGGFTNSNLRDGTGNIYSDQRISGQANPIWTEDVSIEYILQFQDKILNKAQSTGDYKLYLQEYLLGKEAGDKEQYIFSDFCFSDKGVANFVKNNLPELGREINMLHMFDHYVLVVPNEYANYVTQFCQKNDISFNNISCTNTLYNNIDTLINTNTIQDTQQSQLNNYNFQEQYSL